mgnify:FL=1
MALEAQKDCNNVANILGLLKVLGDSGEVSASQMQKGFLRVEGHVADLALDIPDATSKLEHIKSICKKHGVLTVDT